MIFLVNARHLDYSSTSKFLKTVAKHPSDGSKNGDVGHAWIYLKGEEGVIEGGHSGELGIMQPKYMEGVLDNVTLGATNPVSYLWSSQCDGFFQKGNGGHEPTFAAKVLITQKEYEMIKNYIKSYPFQQYALTDTQCCYFVKEIAKLIGIDLEDQVTLKIDQYCQFQASIVKMWQDPFYQYLTFSSPDKLEKSLKKLVQEKRAMDVLKWYKKTHPRCIKCRFKIFINNLKCFPERLIRYQSF